MKTRFRTLILACVIASPLAHAGIPVAVDADPMRDVQWAQELKRWMETARHYQSQIQAYKDQLATATGVRDIADFVDQAKGLKADLEKLRKPGQALNDLLLSGGSPGSSMRCTRSIKFSTPATLRNRGVMPTYASSRSSTRLSSLSKPTRFRTR